MFSVLSGTYFRYSEIFFNTIETLFSTSLFQMRKIVNREAPLPVYYTNDFSFHSMAHHHLTHSDSCSIDIPDFNQVNTTLMIAEIKVNARIRNTRCL